MEVPTAQSSTGPPPSAAYPRWVMFERYNRRYGYGCDSSYFTGDVNTLASAHTTTGHQIQASLLLADPPASSRVCLQLQASTTQGAEARDTTVIAAHGDSVLVAGTVVQDPSGNTPDYTTNHFVYRAGDAAAVPPRPPSLSLLPPYYVADKNCYSGRPKSRDLSSIATGIVRHGEDEIVVAELTMAEVTKDDTPELRAAELFLFRFGRWIVIKSPAIRNGDPEFGVLHAHSFTDAVVPVGDRMLCWVNLDRGLLLCDVFEERLVLEYVKLPVYPCRTWPSSAKRNVCATASGSTLKLVDVFPRCCCGGEGTTEAPTASVLLAPARSTADIFVYNAGGAAADPPRRPSLSLLPPCYLTFGNRWPSKLYLGNWSVGMSEHQQPHHATGHRCRCCCGGKGATLTGCLRSLNAYTINTWTLRVSDMEWVKDGMFHNTELWGLDAYYDERLPRLVPTYPVVSMDEPHTISFLLRDEDGYDPWLITVDMKSKTLRSATQNFRGSWGTHGRTLIPSSLSYYLNSSPSCISNVNLMGQSHIEKPQMAMVDEQVRDYDVDNLTMQSSCQPSTEPAVQASEILAALEEIPAYGLDDDMLKAAYRILRRDYGRRFRSLLSVPMNLRKDWLLMEIETSED
ncbi:unnamed protein product [Urochloa decumbens]|uniref:DUF1618 domain-containing protein n=1 Tax=Urochloa decumbens TaxID=240449 RepID=A0ABC9AYV5_9POAL